MPVLDINHPIFYHSYMKKVKITAELSPAEEGGYVVYCPELDITTEGETIEEAIYMLKDAATGYIEVVGIENIPHFSRARQIQELELVVNG
jgi:predicted RNase H-like HicB family nuclease